MKRGKRKAKRGRKTGRKKDRFCFMVSAHGLLLTCGFSPLSIQEMRFGSMEWRETSWVSLRRVRVFLVCVCVYDVAVLIFFCKFWQCDSISWFFWASDCQVYSNCWSSDKAAIWSKTRGVRERGETEEKKEKEKDYILTRHIQTRLVVSLRKKRTTKERTHDTSHTRTLRHIFNGCQNTHLICFTFTVDRFNIVLRLFNCTCQTTPMQDHVQD